MRIVKIAVEGFRCLHQCEITLDPTTILIGANGAGKSSVLHALRWFFNGGELEQADLTAHDSSRLARVCVTFEDLSPADLEAVGAYAIDDSVTFWRVWSQDGGQKVVGRALGFAPFQEVRRHTAAADAKAEYEALRTDRPELGLPRYSSKPAAESAMVAFEAGHRELLEPHDIPATHLFSPGQARFAGRFDFVMIPAVADVGQETQDGRGTLLRQMLERSGGRPEVLTERLAQLQAEVAEKVRAIMDEEQERPLADLSAALTTELQVLLPNTRVRLDPVAAEPNLGSSRISLTIDDGHLPTDVGHQGHGLQRSLFYALVRQIAQAPGTGDPPGLCLAIEEPELYQHPVQARHFANVLASLPRTGDGAVQVIYATHNEHFVETQDYRRLRRIGRCHTEGVPCAVARITKADPGAVATRLAGLVPSERIDRRVSLTLGRALREAVFARAVLLVEGRSDCGAFAGVADRGGGLDPAGVSLVAIGGKDQLAVPYVILSELEIPVYLVFDGDADIEQRMLEGGKKAEEAKTEQAKAAGLNRQLLRLLGQAEEDFPPSVAAPTYAVMHDSLDSELRATWPQMLAKAAEIKAAASDWRGKPEECWREAAESVDVPPPPLLQSVIDSVLALVDS